MEAPYLPRGHKYDRFQYKLGPSSDPLNLKTTQGQTFRTINIIIIRCITICINVITPTPTTTTTTTLTSPSTIPAIIIIGTVLY